MTLQHAAVDVELSRHGCTLQATVLDGPGPAVVVAPAALSTRALSATAVAPLIGHRRLVLLEPRGHGTSVCRHPQHYTWQVLAEDLLAWIDELALDNCSLIGTSLGSIVALAAAVARPQLVSRLVLASPVYVADDVTPDPDQSSALAALARAFGDAGRPNPDATASALGQLQRGQEQLHRMALGLHTDLESVATYFRAKERGPLPWTAEDLLAVQVPALVVPGEDAIHPSAVAVELSRRLPQARLVQAHQDRVQTLLGFLADSALA